MELSLAVFESAWILWFLMDENLKAYLKETVRKSFYWCARAAEREEERGEEMKDNRGEIKLGITAVWEMTWSWIWGVSPQSSYRFVSIVDGLFSVR